MQIKFKVQISERTMFKALDACITNQNRKQICVLQKSNPVNVYILQFPPNKHNTHITTHNIQKIIQQNEKMKTNGKHTIGQENESIWYSTSFIQTHLFLSSKLRIGRWKLDVKAACVGFQRKFLIHIYKRLTLNKPKFELMV